MTTERSESREAKASGSSPRREQFARLRATALSTTVGAESPRGLPEDGPLTIQPEESSREQTWVDMAVPAAKVPDPEPRKVERPADPPADLPVEIERPQASPQAPTIVEGLSSPTLPGLPAAASPSLVVDPGPDAVPPFRFDTAESSVPSPPVALPAFTLAKGKNGAKTGKGGAYPVEELYRKLRDKVVALFPTDQPAAMVWISPTGSEDTSGHLAEFALALAENCDGEILLVDANVQSSALSNYFGMNERPGLAEVLSKRLHPQAAGHSTALARVHVLPTGGDDAPRLLRRTDQDGWKPLLEKLKARYRYVLIDAPGAEEPHCLALAKAADTSFLVIGLDYTPRETVHEALEVLQLHKANVAGCVLTDPPR